MKIGIITIQKCDNFGADLQAYALQKKLQSLGYEAENIDYLFYKNPRHQKGVGESPVLPLSLVNRLKERLFPFFAWLKNLKKSRLVKARRERFEAWTSKNIRCGAEYRSIASLYENPPRYDLYMVGSDQVWNPRMGSNILPYFLDFAPSSARKVSYAASFGVSSLSTPAFLKYRELLSGFTHIGLRESRGAEIVSYMRLKAEVQHVLDPTLLLSADDWVSVAIEPTSKPSGDYLLLYDLVASSEVVALAKRIASKAGRSFVRIGDGAYGPGEFLWLFAHATCVVTTSFHGTAFSVLNEKNFMSVIPRGMTNASRIESLLETVGLKSRLAYVDSCAAVEEISPIDWSSVRPRLDEARRMSVDFLVRAVTGETHAVPRKLIGERPRLCRAVWNCDASVRAISTSGGLFTYLAEAVIRRGGIVYGAAFDKDFRHVHHVAARTVEELAPLRQSKYVASDAKAAIQEAVDELKGGRTVLFTGCPCQVFAMKSAARDCNANLLTVDIVCHGAPRPEVFASYVAELEQRHQARLVRYEFRNKDKGWNFPNIVYAFDNGKMCRVIPWLDSYFHGFSVNAFLQRGCYSCPFATLERTGDITIGDCWRVAASHPQWDDERGTSLVFGNSERGVAFLRSIGLDDLPGGEYPLDLAEKRNMPLVQPAVGLYRAAFDKIFAETGAFERASACYMTWRRCLKYRVFYWIKKLGWFYFRHHQ